MTDNKLQVRVHNPTVHSSALQFSLCWKMHDQRFAEPSNSPHQSAIAPEILSWLTGMIVRNNGSAFDESPLL